MQKLPPQGILPISFPPVPQTNPRQIPLAIPVHEAFFQSPGPSNEHLSA